MFATKPSSVVTSDTLEEQVDQNANCSVVLIRDGRPVGRFNVPNDANGSALIRLCFKPREFTGLLHKLAIQGNTLVEMIKSDGESFTYTYRG